MKVLPKTHETYAYYCERGRDMYRNVLDVITRTYPSQEDGGIRLRYTWHIRDVEDTMHQPPAWDLARWGQP